MLLTTAARALYDAGFATLRDIAEQVTDRLQTSSTDATANRVLLTGAFGLGGEAVVVPDANAAYIGSLGYHTFQESTATAANYPALGGTATTVRAFSLQTIGTTAHRSQIAVELLGTGTVAGRTFTRGFSGGAWGAWSELASEASTASRVAALDAATLKKLPVAIPDAADLNTYLQSGTYHQPGNVRASNGTNYPVPLAGLLSVTRGQVDDTYTYQTYQVYDGGGVYQRARYVTAWSAWKKLAETKADVGLGNVQNLSAIDMTNTGLQSIPVIELNRGSSGDRYTAVDLHSHGNPGAVDFSGRLYRTAGANGTLGLVNTGTGGIDLVQDGNVGTTVKTASGTITFGPFNPGFGHIWTDRPEFHFNKKVNVQGRLQVGYGETSSMIEMMDSDEGVRYIHNNSGLIGFLNNAGNWTFRVADNGTVWTAQFGDLGQRIEDRATAIAAGLANARVSEARTVSDFVHPVDGDGVYLRAGAVVIDVYVGGNAYNCRKAYLQIHRPDRGWSTIWRA